MIPSRQLRDLVTEQAEPPEQPYPDGAFGDYAAARAFAPGGRLLDDESRLGYVYLERRVVEVAAIPMLESRREPLEDTPVVTDGVAARAERKPVQIDCGHLLE